MNAARKIFSPHPTGQRGFMLIEVLVALAVLSIGAVAVAYTHLMALREQKDAHMRSISVQMVSDMSERIRMNPAAIVTPQGQAANGYVDTVNTTFAAASKLRPVDLRNAGGTGQYDNELQRASHDLDSWRRLIIERYGQGVAAGTLEKVAGQPDARRITVMWLERKKQGNKPTQADSNCPPEVQAPNEVRCLSVVVRP